MKLFFKFSIGILLFFSVGFFESINSQEVFPCVWRNPEMTMTRLFPKARDYKTITVKISGKQLKVIESRADKLLPGQEQAFQYFEMINASGKVIGYTMASTQKGKYGAIEFVFGLNKFKKIIGIYIQRARERDREFKKKTFLNQFVNKGIDDTKRMKAWVGISAPKTAGTSAIVKGIVKELVAWDVLVGK